MTGIEAMHNALGRVQVTGVDGLVLRVRKAGLATSQAQGLHCQDQERFRSTLW